MELLENRTVTAEVESVIVAIIVWVVLQKTKFGFELKATGINKLAAKYCGMREKRNIIVTMMISGVCSVFTLIRAIVSPLIRRPALYSTRFRSLHIC